MHVVKFKSLQYALDLIKSNSIFLNSPFSFDDPIDSYFVTLFGGTEGPTIRPIQEYIDISKKVSVFCATSPENINNVLMWTHYANFHRGIAIVYEVPDSPPGRCSTVDYDDHSHGDFREAIGNGSPMNIPHTTYEQKVDNVLRSVFLKNREWAYEREIRYVRVQEKHDSRVEAGWKVHEVYIGCRFLESTSEELEQIEQIVDYCRDAGIRIYEMSYNYDDHDKRYLLKRLEWMDNPHILPDENYFRILRSIKEVRKNRLLKSKDGKAIQDIAREIAAEEFEKRWKDKMTTAASGLY